MIELNEKNCGTISNPFLLSVSVCEVTVWLVLLSVAVGVCFIYNEGGLPLFALFTAVGFFLYLPTTVVAVTSANNVERAGRLL